MAGQGPAIALAPGVEFPLVPDAYTWLTVGQPGAGPLAAGLQLQTSGLDDGSDLFGTVEGTFDITCP